nr:putative ribonuclease H-like domain-containing protein [Tanacetum cinerariifolium]
GSKMNDGSKSKSWLHTYGPQGRSKSFMAWVSKVLVAKPQNKTPYELLTGDKPAIGYLMPFGCQDSDSDSDDEQDVIIVQNSPTLVTTPVHDVPNHEEAAQSTQEQEGKDATQRLRLAFPTHVVTNEALFIPAEKSSSVSPASTPTASAGNTPPMSPRPLAGRSSKSTGKKLASSSKTLIPGGRSVSADKSIPADMSISASRDTNSADRHPSKLSSNAVSKRFPPASNTQNSDIHDGLKLFDCPSTGIFSSSSYDDEYHRPDISNQEKEILVNPVTTKKKKAKAQVPTKNAFVSYIQDQRRNNHTDFQLCLFSCFLSQMEPTSVAQALLDPDWVEAMQEELQQFQSQRVWVLVELPKGNHAIGTKWILKNKKDARAIVCRNKARLVSQEGDENATNLPAVPPTPQAPHTLSTIKLPILKKEGLHKGYDRFQNLLSQLKIHGAGVSTEDANQKFLRSLPSSWSQVSSIMRTKPGVDTLSFNDLYKNLGVFEFDVAMISTRLKKFYKKTRKKLQFDAKEPVGIEKTKVKCYNCHNTRHFARECKSKGNQENRRRDAGNIGYKAKDNGRRPAKQDEHKAMVNINGEGSDTEVTTCSKVCEESYVKLKKLYDEQREQLEAEKEKEELKTKLENFQSSSKGLSKLLNSQMSAEDKSRLGYGNQIHKGVLSYENEFLESVFESRSSDVEDSLMNDRFAKDEGMHAVPPPMIGIYMPLKYDFRIDESKFTYGPKQSKTSKSNAKTSDFDSCESSSNVETLEYVPKPVESKPKAVSEPKVWYDAPIFKEYESDINDEYVFKATVEQEKPSCAFINTIKHVKLLGKLLKTKTHVVKILKLTKETRLV